MTTFREAFPVFTVEDVDRAVDSYRSTFGFEQTYSFEEEDGTTAYAFLRLEPLGIGGARRASADDPSFALWLYTNDVDAAAESLRAAGADELLPPTDQPWGEHVHVPRRRRHRPPRRSEGMRLVLFQHKLERPHNAVTLRDLGAASSACVVSTQSQFA